MISFRDIDSIEQVEAYRRKLENGYGDRPEIVQHIISQIKSLSTPKPTVAELCLGPGILATALCHSIPDLRFVGIDFKQPFLDYVALSLPATTQAEFLLADLTGEEWPQQLEALTSGGSFDAIITMQSLHDVGGAERVSKIYHYCHTLLRPGGLFLNADLVTPAGQDPTHRPNRLTVAHHLELLNKAGFQNVACTFERNEFGCCQGIVPVIN